MQVPDSTSPSEKAEQTNETTSEARMRKDGMIRANQKFQNRPVFPIYSRSKSFPDETEETQREALFITSIDAMRLKILRVYGKTEQKTRIQTVSSKVKNWKVKRMIGIHLQHIVDLVFS